jgi:hypothetical protein
MSDCVNLQLLDALAAAAQAVPDIKDVSVNPSEGTDKDAMRFPHLFLFDEPETVAWANRLEQVSFVLHAELWVEGKDFARTAQNIRAELKKKFYSDVDVRKLSAAIRERGAEKFYFEENVMGGIVIRYDVTYRTKTMDPFTQANY